MCFITNVLTSGISMYMCNHKRGTHKMYACRKKCTHMEWINFVDANPQYLTINNKDHLKAITMSLAKGLVNIASVTTPLENLRARLTRDELIKAQKVS